MERFASELYFSQEAHLALEAVKAEEGKFDPHLVAALEEMVRAQLLEPSSMSGMQGRTFPGDEGGLKIPVKTEPTDPIRIHSNRRWFLMWPGWLLLVIFLLWVLTFGNTLPPWGLGWTLVFGLLYSCKWLAWWRVRDVVGKTTLLRTVGYLLLWPGMDAKAFLDIKANPPKPTAAEWKKAFLKTGLGAVLVWGLARRLPPKQPLLIGAVGTIGFIFLFLLGGFHLVALLWGRAGVNARHLMDRPAFATLLGEFWGARWNLACH